jgi:hypothetical protein
MGPPARAAARVLPRGSAPSRDGDGLSVAKAGTSTYDGDEIQMWIGAKFSPARPNLARLCRKSSESHNKMERTRCEIFLEIVDRF